MDSRQGNTPGGAAPTAAATTLVHSLHVVCKNLAIYPPSHPRVVTAADALVARIRAQVAPGAHAVVLATGEQMTVDGAPAADACRLPERFRDAGLRGAAFAHECTPPDVLAFVDALNRARARTGTGFAAHWAGASDRIEPLPLVFTGVHSTAAGGGQWTTAPGDGGPPTAAAPKPRNLRELVAQLGTSEAVQSKLRAIEVQACDPEVADERELDLLATIADLLPADVSNDPDAVAKALTDILARVEKSLGELVRRNARVKGAELLRVALDIARKYFHTEAPAQLPQHELPTGRPEDARIVADLGLLLQEIQQLPDAYGVCLPRAEDLGEDSATVALRMCGIVLHLLAHSANPAIVPAALPRLQRTVPRLLCDLLALYVGPDAGNGGVTTAGRVRILQTVLAAGRLDLVRSQRYVDGDFLARGFPDTLPLAARVLGGDAVGRRTLHEALARLGPVLQMGGAAAAARAGVLYDPAVVGALVAIGGEAAQLLLQQAVAQASPTELQALFECARTLALPPAEAAALRAVACAEQLPRDYLPLLLSAAARGDFAGPLRAASGSVLRQAVELGLGTLDHAQLLRAVEALTFAPGLETRSLLQRIAGAGRLTRLDRKSRELRRAARAVLAAITERSPR
jgi:hypothetical protein